MFTLSNDCDAFEVYLIIIILRSEFSNNYSSLSFLLTPNISDFIVNLINWKHCERFHLWFTKALSFVWWNSDRTLKINELHNRNQQLTRQSRVSLYASLCGDVLCKILMVLKVHSRRRESRQEKFEKSSSSKLKIFFHTHDSSFFVGHSAYPWSFDDPWIWIVNTKVKENHDFFLWDKNDFKNKITHKCKRKKFRSFLL